MKLKKVFAIILAITSLAAFTACETALSLYAEDYEYITNKLQGSLNAAKDLADIASGKPSSNNKQEEVTIDAVGFVTQAEYESAIEKAITATNSTAREEISYNFTDNPAASLYYLHNSLNADDKGYYYGTDEGQEYAYYIATVEGENYIYEKLNGVWTQNAYTNEVDYSNAQYSEILNLLKTVYSQLTYNKDETVFKAESITFTNPEDETDTQTVTNVTVKFVEKEFSSLSFVTPVLNDENKAVGSTSYTLSIVDQGKTAVTLPQL